jgi:hypothetical protein
MKPKLKIPKVMTLIIFHLNNPLTSNKQRVNKQRVNQYCRTRHFVLVAKCYHCQ